MTRRRLPENNANGRTRAGRGSVRIIGGEWRGRRLHFPLVQDLRPTGDRIRETVFNWLTPSLPAAHCLDLFAGSGALIVEALSRGAGSALAVDSEPRVVDALRESAHQLGTDRLEIRLGRWDSVLAGRAVQPFDIVFLDPPFKAQLLAQCMARLSEGGWLAPGALVYFEQHRHHVMPALPDGWQLYRDKLAGDVRYGLIRTA